MASFPKYITMKKTHPEQKDFLSSVSKHLIINASFLDDPGLYNGKMGIVLFFAHYAKWSGKEICNDFASKLLDEVYAQIHTDTPINFSKGLCGIGWGMEYLLQNDFLEGNSNDILAAIDEKVMERDPLRMQDAQFETGASGILYYVITRIISSSHPKEEISFDRNYLQAWEAVMEQEIKAYPDQPVSDHPFLRWVRGEEVKIDLNRFLRELIAENDLYDEEYIYLPFTLKKGCAGMGLKNILG